MRQQYLLLSVVSAFRLLQAQSFHCVIDNDSNACMTKWCNCASGITTSPLQTQTQLSYFGSTPKFYTTVVTAFIGQYTLDHTGACNYAEAPLAGPPLCIPSRPFCVTPVQILSSGHCVPSSPLLTIPGATLTANSVGHYIIGTQTLAAGSSPITVSGIPISLAPSATALIVATSTQSLMVIPAAPASVSSVPSSAAIASPVPAASSAPAGPSAPLRVSTLVVSLAPTTASSTKALAAPPTLTLASSTYTANSEGRYMIGGQTLVPGGPAVTVSGTPISLAKSATVLIIESNMNKISTGASAPRPIDTSNPSLPAGAVIVTTTEKGVAATATFKPALYQQYTTLTTLMTITTQEQGSTWVEVIGPGGLGWEKQSVSLEGIQIPPPTKLSTVKPTSIVSAEDQLSTITSFQSFSAETTSTLSGVTGGTLLRTSKNGQSTTVPAFCGNAFLSLFHTCFVFWGIGWHDGMYVLPPVTPVLPPPIIMPPTIVIKSGIPTAESTPSHPSGPSTNHPSELSTGQPSSSTCTQTTARSCSTTTICPVGAKGAACTTTSTCSAAATGCSVFPSSTSTTVASTKYFIYPKERRNSAQTDAIRKLLLSYVDKTEIYTSEGLGVSFWYAPLTPEQVKMLQSNPSVGSVHLPDSSYDPNEGEVNGPIRNNPIPRGSGPEPTTTLVRPHVTINRRDRGLTRQSPAVEEMVFISQPQGIPLANLKPRYVYDASAGSGQTVYIVDTGADLTHDEFTKGKNIASKVQWLFPNPDLVNAPGDDEQAHGTGVLCKVTGDQFGLSKDIKPVVVRVGPKLGATPDHYLNGVQQVLNDVRAKSAQGLLKNAVLNMSWVYPTHRVPQVWIDTLRDLLQQLVILGVFPIAGSGNIAGPVDGYPALFAGGHTPAVPELLVVGAVHNDGSLWPGTMTADFVTVHAPGYKVNRAYLHQMIVESSGTSFATGSVSGLAAYLAGLSSVTDQLPPRASGTDRVNALKRYIETLAHRRDQRFPLAIWNGVDATNFHYNPLQCAVQKRGDKVPSASICTAPDEDPPSSGTSAVSGVPKSNNRQTSNPAITGLLGIGVKPSVTASSSSSASKPSNAKPSVTESKASTTVLTSGPPITTSSTSSKTETLKASVTPEPTRAIEIMLDVGNAKGVVFADYSVYSYNPAGTGRFDACSGGFWHLSATSTAKPTDYPTRVGPFTQGFPSGCLYAGPSTGVGSLSCPGMKTPTSCVQATLPSKTNCHNGANGIDTFYPQAVCSW